MNTIDTILREDGHMGVCSRMCPVEECGGCQHSFAILKSGNFYKIDYEDMNYPCSCGCHTNPNVKHIIPCCSDNSYKGLAYLVCVTECAKSFFLLPSNRRWIMLGPMNKFVPTEKTFDVNQESVHFIKNQVSEHLKIADK